VGGAHSQTISLVSFDEIIELSALTVEPLFDLSFDSSFRYCEGEDFALVREWDIPDFLQRLEDVLWREAHA